MGDITTADRRKGTKIDCIHPTQESLSSRGGLSLFVRYLKGIGLDESLERLFGSIRRSRKGQPIAEIFKQLFCFLVDGTSRHLAYFDHLRDDAGYAGVIESAPETLLSCHAVKRFFRAFWWPRIYLFRRLLQKLFLWRLQLAQPKVIVLGIDTMVLDNHYAHKRHGVRHTYKKVKGFAPLQMTWDRFLVDAVFRAGDHHSNHSDTVEKMVDHVVRQIRKHYRRDVPIVIRSDSGFFDQKLFAAFEALQVGYLCTGKLYGDVKILTERAPEEAWTRFKSKGTIWEYIEFGDRRGSWKQFRRAIYCRRVSSNGQLFFDFARSHTVFYTNIGHGGLLQEQLREAGLDSLLDPKTLILNHHDRGKDELVHRALKDFAAQELPFTKFAQNAAFYYTMLLAFNVYEAFKEDVCAPAIPISSYATTFRRKIIDIAAKLVRHAGRIILKVPQAAWQHLKLQELWEKSAKPPVFQWV